MKRDVGRYVHEADDDISLAMPPLCLAPVENLGLRE